MPLPESYTEQSLAEFMLAELRATARDLGWTDASGPEYEEPINDTLIAYGVSTVEEATNIQRLRALARVFIWEAATKETTPNISHSADGASFSDDQVYQHCLQQSQIARARASTWLGDDFLPSTALDFRAVF